jgi:hypothetical protein
MTDEQKKQLEELFKSSAEKAQEFSNSLMAMRMAFTANPEELKDEETQKEFMRLSSEIDARISFLLRSLLVQHGQVLWL